MSESLRPLESAPIGNDLRIRLEGSIELLEDALPLMDSVEDLLSRAEPSRDDVRTLQECINQLPRLAEALGKAQQHEAAAELTRTLRGRFESARVSANARLTQLGCAEQPSLRAALIETAKHLRSLGTPPGPGETQLLASPGPPVLFAVMIALAASGLAWFGVGSPWNVVLGVVAFLLSLRGLTPRPWVLLPDRLFFPAHAQAPSRECRAGELEGARVEGGRVVVKLSGEELELHSESAERLLSVIELLRGPWLTGLTALPRPSVVLKAEGGSPPVQGLALLSPEGVLFVPRSAAAAQSLATERLPAPPPPEELLALLAHVPPERWAAVCEQLEQAGGALWLHPGELAVEPAANSVLGRVVSARGQRVRLSFAAPSGGGDQVPRADALLEKLGAGTP